MISTSLPRFTVPVKPDAWDVSSFATWEWTALEPLPPFILADGSRPAIQQTTVRLCHDGDALYIRFDCDDDDPWGTLKRRDDPIYNEEVVELFIGAGEETPFDYYEFEISPNGILFDAKVHSPNGNRTDLRVDVDWDAPNLRWRGERSGRGRWSAFMVLPWMAIAPPNQKSSHQKNSVWRANFYRIERPREGRSSYPTEFSCWSSTLTEPADFHRPARFGFLELA
jgi:hypothetical protein